MLKKQYGDIMDIEEIINNIKTRVDEVEKQEIVKKEKSKKRKIIALSIFGFISFLIINFLLFLIIYSLIELLNLHFIYRFIEIWMNINELTALFLIPSLIMAFVMPKLLKKISKEYYHQAAINTSLYLIVFSILNMIIMFFKGKSVDVQFALLISAIVMNIAINHR